MNREIFKILIENRFNELITATNKEDATIAYGSISEVCYIAYLENKISEKEYWFLHKAYNYIYFESDESI